MSGINFSIAYLTYAPLMPPDAISLAAKLGYDHIGLRILPAAVGGEFAPLTTDKVMLRETQQRLKDTGIRVFDMEIVRIGPSFDVAAYKSFFDISAALQAKAILVAGDDPDLSRLTDSYTTFCEAAAPYNLTANIEFMPWTTVKDCNTARHIAEKSCCKNAGILVDALHAARSTTTLKDLAGLPKHFMTYHQICDAPAEIPQTDAGLIHTARCARLLPGEGGIDLREMFKALPQNMPISIEIPNDEMKAKFGIEEWSRRALEASYRTLA
jgi:sugar phosphate isomerase/epimerase